jgi:hypothetical protein
MSAQIFFDMEVGEAFEYREKTQALAVKAVEERAAKAAAKAAEKAAPEEKPAAAAPLSIRTVNSAPRPRRGR